MTPKLENYRLPELQSNSILEGPHDGQLEASQWIQGLSSELGSHLLRSTNTMGFAESSSSFPRMPSVQTDLGEGLWPLLKAEAIFLIPTDRRMPVTIN